MKKGFIASLILFSSISAAFGQNNLTENTLKFENSQSPQATIEDVAWIAGHWTGEAFGGIGEEIWSEPMAGAMMGSYRIVVNDTVSFYEFMIIRELNNSLILQIKHFNRDLTGWEEKDESEEFVLVKKEGDRMFFDGFTFEKVGDDQIRLYVAFEDAKTDTFTEYVFPYERKKN